VSSANTAAVFVVVPVDHIVTAVFDAPVFAICAEDLFGISLSCCTAGDSLNDFIRDFAGFLVDALSFNDEGLADMREIQIAIESRRRPYFAGFNATVIAGRNVNMFGCLPVFKEQLNILLKQSLIGFDGKMIVGFTFDDIAR